MRPRDDAEPDAERLPTNIEDGREGNGLTSYFFIGLLGVFALERSLDSLLYGATSADPLVLAAVAVVLAGVAVAAGAVPARRATRISPLVALAE